MLIVRYRKLPGKGSALGCNVLGKKSRVFPTSATTHTITPEPYFNRLQKAGYVAFTWFSLAPTGNVPEEVQKYCELLAEASHVSKLTSAMTSPKARETAEKPIGSRSE